VTTRVGAAHGIVTPNRPGPLAGYAARGGAVATSTIDDLEATVLVLDAGPRLVWITLDAVAVTTALADLLTAAARAAVGPDARVLVAASHTHSGPAHWLGDFAPGHRAPLDEVAVAELADRVALIAADAVARLADCDLDWSEPTIHGVAAPRLTRSEAVPVQAGVLTASVGGRVMALLVDVPCHPTVLGPASTGWSADWPGAMRRRVRAAHPGVEVAFLGGACGDLSTRFTRREASVAEVERLGGVVADAILAGAVRARSVAGNLEIESIDIALPTRSVDIDAAVERLTRARAGADAYPDDAVARSVADGAEVEVDIAVAAHRPVIDVPVTVVGFDGVRWIATPLELFSSTAATLRRHGSVRLLGCVDGYLGYLPDAAAVAADSYEARTALFSDVAESAFRAALSPFLTTPPRS